MEGGGHRLPEMEGGGLHIAMLPWLACGHLLPFLQLSIALAKFGFRISFLSTPKNIRRLPKLPLDLTAQITFVDFPLPQVDGLDPSVEATVDLPTPADGHLKKAYDLLLPQLRLFLSRHRPDFLVHDVLAHWTAEIARSFGVPRVVFSIYSAGPISFFGVSESISADQLRDQYFPAPEALISPPPWITFPSKVAFRPHEAEMLFSGFFEPDASGVSAVQRVMSAFDGCEAVILRSCEEYEREHLNVLRKYPKHVLPVGLLPPEKMNYVSTGTGSEWEGIFQWLDGKPPRSVVFVVFGSECKLSRDEVYEIAHGLDLSELGFLWALRRPEWAPNDSEILPPGFIARTTGRGMVNLGWAPQTEILAHPSIGGSMFHAGWGSIIEMVQYGHPLVLLPFNNSQALDARLAVEKGLAMEVERERDGVFHRDEIAKSLRKAMVEEDGELIRHRSREMMAIFSDRELHERYLSEFVKFLKRYKTK